MRIGTPSCMIREGKLSQCRSCTVAFRKFRGTYCAFRAVAVIGSWKSRQPTLCGSTASTRSVRMLGDACSMMAASTAPAAAMTTAVGPHTTRVNPNSTTVEANSWLQNIILHHCPAATEKPLRRSWESREP